MTTFPAFPLLGEPFGPIAPGSSREAKPAVLTARFGGRYSQRTGDGVNALPRDIQFRSTDLSAADLETIDAFLKGRKGYLPFTYTPPFESAPRQFICSTWTVNWTNRLHGTVSATFEENFDP